MKKLFLHTHMGLGDQIMCHSLVRHYCKLYDIVYFYVKEKNYVTVSFMFRDIKNIKFIKFNPNIIDEYSFINSFKQLNIDAEHLDIGFSYLNPNRDIYLDEQFFEQANVDFSTRFSEFYVERNKSREIELFEKLNLANKKYILICNESSGGKYDINYKVHTKYPDAEVVYTEFLTDNMFDWVYIAMNALEIYAIESAFRLMIDSFKLSQPLYVKLKVKNKAVIPSTQNNWIEIE